MFAYCGNNPINYFDKSGRVPDSLPGLAGEAIGEWLYELFTGNTHPNKQARELDNKVVAQQNEIITDIAKTADEAGVIDTGMASYHSIQAARSFKKAIAYAVAPILTPTDEGFAIGYAVKGLYHLIRSIGRATK